MSLFGHTLSFLMQKLLGVECPGHMINICLTLVLPNNFLKATSLHSHKQFMRVLYVPHPHQYLVFSIFLILAILVDIYYGFNLHFLLITNNVEHLFHVLIGYFYIFSKAFYFCPMLSLHFPLNVELKMIAYMENP